MNEARINRFSMPMTRRDLFGRVFGVGAVATILACEQKLPAEAYQPMDLATLIREQNENGLKKKIGTKIELKLEKEVSTKSFTTQEGYIPVWGTFTDAQGKPVTFGMALDPISPLRESLKKDPTLHVDTKIKMKVIPSPNTYKIEDMIRPPQQTATLK